MSDVLTGWPDLAFVERGPQAPRLQALPRLLNTAPLWAFVGLLAFGWILLPCLAEISGSDLAGSRPQLFLYLLVREGFLCGAVAWLMARHVARRGESDNRVDAVGQAMQSAIALVDGRQRVRYANRAFLRLFQTDRDAVLNERLDRALGLDLTEAQLAAVLPPRGKSRAMLSTVRQGRPMQIEVEVVHYQERQGVEWWVLLASGAVQPASDPLAPRLTLAA